MSNQKQPPSEPEKEARPPAPPPASPPGPFLEIERSSPVPSSAGADLKPVETFVREDVLPSYSDRRPTPAPPPPPVAPAPSPVTPPPAAQPPSAEGEAVEGVKAQLSALRSRNRLLKYLLIFLTLIVLMIAASIAFLYNKIAAFLPSGATYQSGAMESFSSEPPAPPRASSGGQFPSLGPSQGGSSLFLVKGPGGQSAGQGADQGWMLPLNQLSPQETAAINAAIAKYSQRPLVKEFLEDLKKDPKVGAAFADGKQPTIQDFMAVISNPASVQGLTMKYAVKPGFMALMMEFIADPAFKPVMGNMQGMIPSVPGQAVPQFPPPGAAGPSAQRAGAGEPRLDAGAIGAPAPARKVAPKTVPSP